MCTCFTFLQVYCTLQALLRNYKEFIVDPNVQKFHLTVGRPATELFAIILRNRCHCCCNRPSIPVQQQQQQQSFILTRLFFPVYWGQPRLMAFPQHFPLPWPVPSILLTKSLLSHIFFQHFSPSLPGPTFHSITIYLQCLNSLYPTQLISPLNMTKPPQPVSSHHFSNIINCQHAPHTFITFPFT